MIGAQTELGACADALAAVLGGRPHPLGVPWIFIRDDLASTAPAKAHSANLERVRQLELEYAQAEGYSFDWGQLIEQRLGDVTIWRIVAIDLWRDAELDHPESERIVSLTAALHAVVRERIPLHPHPAVVLSGCSGGGQRAAHALLSLLCMEPLQLQEVRLWLVSEFLGRMLPGLLSACRTWLNESRRATCVKGLVRGSQDAGEHSAGDGVAAPSTAGAQRSNRSA